MLPSLEAAIHAGMAKRLLDRLIVLSHVSLVCLAGAAMASRIEARAAVEWIVAKNERVTVELDIFSGRPNPAWPLSDAEAVQFLAAAAGLPKAAAKELSGNLGYRGFIVRVTGGTDERIFTIQNGTVALTQGGRHAYYDDRERALERWLVQSSKPHLTNDLFAMVEAEVAK